MDEGQVGRGMGGSGIQLISDTGGRGCVGGWAGGFAACLRMGVATGGACECMSRKTAAAAAAAGLCGRGIRAAIEAMTLIRVNPN